MICPNCQKEMRLIPAGTSKAGKPYKAFWSCSRECNTTFPYKAPQEEEIPVIEEPEATADQLIMEEIQAVNKRLDKLISYIVKNLPEK